MDELEISGKRYISTRRAGKDYKYHSDYIGQLIRGGKVVGQKVGRAWYVDAESLATYLKEEGLATPAQIKAVASTASRPQEVAKAPEPIVVTPPPAVKIPTPEPVKLDTVDTNLNETRIPVTPVEVTKEEAPVEQKITLTVAPEKESEFTYIDERLDMNKTKKQKGLVYFSDDEPALPPIRKRSRTTTPEIASAPMVEESHVIPEDVRSMEPEDNRKEAVKNFGIKKTATLFGVGVFALLFVTVVSVAVTTTITVEEGKPATVYYSLQ